MASIVCPQCGTTNYREDIGYPQCRGCSEDLERCPTCRACVGGLCRSPRHAARYTHDGEAAKRCPGFVPTAARDARLARELPAPVWVSVLLVAISLVLAAAGWILDPGLRCFRGQPLELQTIAPRQAAVSQPFDIVLRVINPLELPSSRYYLEIDGAFLRTVQIGTPAPAPTRIASYPGRMLLEYAPLAGRQQQVLRLPFIAYRAGTAHFQAKIYAPSNQLLTTVSLQIPVTGPGVARLPGERVVSP